MRYIELIIKSFSLIHAFISTHDEEETERKTKSVWSVAHAEDVVATAMIHDPDLVPLRPKNFTRSKSEMRVRIRDRTADEIVYG